MTSARHSMSSAGWRTPGQIIDAARAVMGVIDLDPASDALAQERVLARHYFTPETNGLDRVWSDPAWTTHRDGSRILINPPGGLVAEFWRKLVEEWLAERVLEAVWVGYSLEQLQTLQAAVERWTRPGDPAIRHTPLHFACCVPSRRIAFEESLEQRAARRQRALARWLEQGFEESRFRFADKGSPSHGNYITYLGHNPERFAEVFDAFGQVFNVDRAPLG